jgi:hypothetical protein
VSHRAKWLLIVSIVGVLACASPDPVVGRWQVELEDEPGAEPVMVIERDNGGALKASLEIDPQGSPRAATSATESLDSGLIEIEFLEGDSSARYELLLIDGNILRGTARYFTPGMPDPMVDPIEFVRRP